MKLWILEQKIGVIDMEHCAYAMVIRAETEEKARLIADNNERQGRDNTDSPWLTPSETSCVELTSSGKEDVICVNMPMR